MNFFDKENIVKNVGYRFEEKLGVFGQDKLSGLAEEIVDIAEEWAQNYTDYPEKKTKRELRRDLKAYIKERLDFKDENKSYFIPTFVWVFIAQQVISWLVKILIEKYLMRLR